MMNHLSVFLNTKIEDNGILAGIGDIGLGPVRYLFHGKTIWIQEQNNSFVIHRVTSFHVEGDGHHATTTDLLRSSSRNMIKAILAIVFLMPGLLFGVFCKGLACLFANVQKNHRLVKMSLTALNHHIGQTYSISVSKEPDPKIIPLTTKIQLGQILHKVLSQNHCIVNDCLTNALIIYGNGKLTIDNSDILKFNPMKLILVNTEMDVSGYSNSNKLEVAMGQSKKWLGKRNEKMKRWEVIVLRVNSIKEALETEPPIRDEKSGKLYHMVFQVSAPQLINPPPVVKKPTKPSNIRTLNDAKSGSTIP